MAGSMKSMLMKGSEWLIFFATPWEMWAIVDVLHPNGRCPTFPFFGWWYQSSHANLKSLCLLLGGSVYQSGWGQFLVG